MLKSMPEQGFYTTGGTVQAGSGVYIRRQADDELLARCRAGEFAYVLTPRQLGKSSLMEGTAEQLALDDIRSAKISLEPIGTQVTAEQWYLGLLVALGDELNLQIDVVQWWQTHTHLGLVQRLTLFFREVLLVEVTGRVVVFVDEIDTTLSLNFTDDFYAAIRYFYNARANVPSFHRLSFVLIGVARPGDLIRDPLRTPFNIGHRVDLTYFTFEEALPLDSGLGLAQNEARQVLRWALKWTGGHPYLTQRLCAAIASEGKDRWSESDVDRVVARTFFGAAAEQDNNLQFVADMLTKRAPDLSAVLTTYQQVRLGRRSVPDEEQSLVKSHLRLSGVVQRKNTKLRISNLIYHEVFDKEWVEQHLPVNWFKRARQVGLFLTVLVFVAAVVIAVSIAIERSKLVAKMEKATQEAYQKLREASDRETKTNDALAKAELNLDKAQTDALRAEQLRQDAFADRLAAQSRLTLTPNHVRQGTGALLAAEAMRRSRFPSLEIDSALRQALDSVPGLMTTPRSYVVAEHERLSGIAFSNTGRYIATAGADTKARVWDVTNQNQKPENAIIKMDHDAPVSAVVFSPAGRYVATASEDKTARLWEVLGGKSLAIMQHEGKVLDITFSADGRYLASASSDKTAIVWEVPSGRRIARLAHDDEVKSITFGPDGRYLATVTSDNTARLWETATRREIPLLLSGYSTLAATLRNAVAFSPDGRYFAAVKATSASSPSTSDGVGLWDILSRRQLHFAGRDVSGTVVALAFSPDGKYVATASDDHSARVWTATSGDPVTAPMQHDGKINALLFSLNGRYLATASDDGTARLLELASGKQVRMNHPGPVVALTFRPTDGRDLATATSGQTVYLWQIAKGPEAVIIEHSRKINALAFSPDGEILATAEDRVAQVFKTATGEQAASEMTHEGIVTLVSASRDGKYLATSTGETVRVWNTMRGTHVSINSQSDVVALALSEDGRCLATAGNDLTTRLWSATTGKPLVPPIKNKLPVHALAYSPDGRSIAVAGEDGTARLLETSAGRELRTMTHDSTVLAVSFSPDGRYLATGDQDRAARVWDTASGKEVATIEHDNEVVAVRIHSAGENEIYLSTVTRDNTARRWDVRTRREIARLSLGSVNSISQDQRFLASAGGGPGSFDSGVKVSYWRPDLLSSELCARLARNLTWSEWHDYFAGEPYRKTCQDLPIQASSFFEAGRKRASAGDVEGAIAIFRNAQALDTKLVVNPEAEARKAAADANLEVGKRRAKMGNIKGAVDSFRSALRLQPDLSVSPGLRRDPTKYARRLWAGDLVSQGSSLAKRGKIDEGIEILHRARQVYPEFKADVRYVRYCNMLCWAGGVWEKPALVMGACEQAVELGAEREKPFYRDSRGVARALLGDWQGAIADFEAFVKDTEDQTKRRQRRSWIEALNKTGKFPQDELKNLRDELLLSATLFVREEIDDDEIDPDAPSVRITLGKR
jgi:WD40 repeat protein/tetratricopeptide (TPR) repeat protein